MIEPGTHGDQQRYVLAGRIGRGGMGEVVAARDEQIGRDVAIKRMHVTTEPDASARFLREAMIQGRLEHPAIVPVHEVGHDAAGRPFIVMKLVTGTTLAAVILDPGTRSLQRVLRGFADVCVAIEFVHVRGIVHRDLKPDNIMFGEFGEVYVLDWGAAKLVGEAEPALTGWSGPALPGTTAVGTVIGTAGYMAPEQARGAADVDGRADVYALGCVLFEILTGEPRDAAAANAAGGEPAREDRRPSVRAPDRKIPPELDELCVRATAADPRSRPSARELGDGVLRYLDGDRDLALRQRLARDHFDAAAAAFHAGATDANRATAMRGAAAAIALDPTLEGPGALVTRLMLEPPAHTPAAVIEAIRADDVRTANAHAKASLLALAVGILLVPFQWWMAPSGSAHLLVYTLLIVIAAGVCALLVRLGRPWPGLIVFGNALIVLVIAVMYSPLLIAPGLGAVLATACVLTPRYSWVGSAVTIGVVMIAVTLGPLALEAMGVLPSTVSVSSTGVRFVVPAVGDRELPSVVGAAIYSAALIAGATAMAALMRHRTRDAHHRLQLQAWQLRQLVPPGVSR